MPEEEQQLKRKYTHINDEWKDAWVEIKGSVTFNDDNEIINVDFNSGPNGPGMGASIHLYNTTPEALARISLMFAAMSTEASELIEAHKK